MGLFRVLIYGIILGVYASALFYDVRFMPRLGVVWWVEKLVMLSMLNLVNSGGGVIEGQNNASLAVNSKKSTQKRKEFCWHFWIKMKL